MCFLFKITFKTGAARLYRGSNLNRLVSYLFNSSEKRSVRDFYEDEAVIHDQTAPCIFVFLVMSVMAACFGARKVDGFFSRKTSSRNIKYK